MVWDIVIRMWCLPAPVKCLFTAMIQRGKLGVSSVASLPIVSAASLPEMITLLKRGTYIGVRSKFHRKILGIRNKLMAGESGTRLLSKHEFYSSPVQALYLFRYFHASYDYICIYIRSALCYPRIFASTSRRENTSRYHDEHAMLA